MDAGAWAIVLSTWLVGMFIINRAMAFDRWCARVHSWKYRNRRKKCN